jgi:hypothetical protein
MCINTYTTYGIENKKLFPRKGNAKKDVLSERKAEIKGYRSRRILPSHSCSPILCLTFILILKERQFIYETCMHDNNENYIYSLCSSFFLFVFMIDERRRSKKGKYTISVSFLTFTFCSIIKLFCMCVCVFFDFCCLFQVISRMKWL